MTAHGTYGHIEASSGGLLAVIGRAASPSDKAAPVNIVPQVREEVKRRGVPPARAECRAVRDSTLVTWYRSVYAPRARGGAYDSHHRTAGIAGCTRRRGGPVAARGARAQQPAMLPTIGFLGSGTPAAHGHWVAAFVQRLRELGWIEGRNLTIDYRWAEGSSDRAAELAAEFVRLKVDVIVTYANPMV